jgi:hypothetical protein
MGTARGMEEHRFTCPTHVREFTRYRAHVDFSADETVAVHPAEDRPAQSPAPDGAEHDVPAAAAAPAAR